MVFNWVQLLHFHFTIFPKINSGTGMAERNKNNRAVEIRHNYVTFVRVSFDKIRGLHLNHLWNCQILWIYKCFLHENRAPGGGLTIVNQDVLLTRLRLQKYIFLCFFLKILKKYCKVQHIKRSVIKVTCYDKNHIWVRKSWLQTHRSMWDLRNIQLAPTYWKSLLDDEVV